MVKFKHIFFPSKKSGIWRDWVTFSINVTFLTSQSHGLCSDVPDQSQDILFSSFQNAGWLHDCKTRYKLYIYYMCTYRDNGILHMCY